MDRDTDLASGPPSQITAGKLWHDPGRQTIATHPLAFPIFPCPNLIAWKVLGFELKKNIALKHSEENVRCSIPA